MPGSRTQHLTTHPPKFSLPNQNMGIPHNNELVSTEENHSYYNKDLKGQEGRGLVKSIEWMEWVNYLMGSTVSCGEA